MRAKAPDCECGRKHYAKGKCQRCYRRDRQRNWPSRQAAGLPAGRPKNAVVNYRGAHQRIKAARGVARNYRCTECGGTAEEWALKPGTENVLYDNTAADSHKPYSLDANDYQPMCRTDHRAMDGYSDAFRLHAGPGRGKRG